MKFFDIGGYIVFSDGKVWSKPKYRGHGGKFLKVQMDKDGYEKITICQGDTHQIKENVRHSNTKRIIRSDGKIYEALSDVKIDGFDIGNVGKCCKGKVKTCKGYTWKYYKEE